MYLCRRPILLLVATVALCTTEATAKDVAIINNKSNAVKSLIMGDLIKICKGVTRRWPDGKEIVVIVRDPESPEMKMVLQRVYGMSAEQVRSFIATVNQGRRERPVILVSNSDQAVVKAVQAMPGAVGIVDVYSITGGINVLKIDGKVPLDPGYVLHGN